MSHMKSSILIVEHEKIVREGLVRALSNSYKAYHASHCNDAIEIIDNNAEIRVVISDIKVPDEADGFEMLEKIRRRNEKIQVIFITAFYSIESAVEAIRKGAFDYIAKPVDLRQLETSIKNAIDNI